MPLFKKKAEMPTPEEIEAGKVKSYKDLIAPSVVSFRRSPGYYILGNTSLEEIDAEPTKEST